MCKRNRTLHRLKQAARGTYDLLSGALKRCQRTLLCTDPAVFFGATDECDIFVVPYVVDLLIICKKKGAPTIVKKEAKKSFVLKDLGRASEYVGIATDCGDKEGTMTLSHVGTIGHCLEKFNIAQCKAVSTLIKKTALAVLRVDAEPAQDVACGEVIGSFLYFVTCT